MDIGLPAVMYHPTALEATGHPRVTFLQMDQADIGHRMATFPQMEVVATGHPRVMFPQTDQEGIGLLQVMSPRMGMEATGPRARKAVAGGSLGSNPGQQKTHPR